MIVLDASAAIEVLLQPALGTPLSERLLAPGSSLHAPHLLDLEVAQVLRRFVTRGEIDPARARQALEDLSDLPVERYPHDLLIARLGAQGQPHRLRRRIRSARRGPRSDPSDL